MVGAAVFVSTALVSVVVVVATEAPAVAAGAGLSMVFSAVFSTGAVAGFSTAVFAAMGAAGCAVAAALIDLFPAQGGAYPLDAYRLVFAFQAGLLVIACAAYVAAREPERAGGT